MIEISKELLSEVLKCKVTKINGMLENVANQNILSYELNDTSINDGKRLINIYELAHKGKEWAVKNFGWTLQSYTNKRHSGICRVKIGDKRELTKLLAPTEAEAIIKACEWIYKEANK